MELLPQSSSSGSNSNSSSPGSGSPSSGTPSSGSPSSGSPSSGSPGSVSPFLPPFLMGDAVSRAAPKQAKISSSVKPQKQVAFNASPRQPLVEPGHILPLVLPRKSNGPPIKGLFDTLDDSFASPKSDIYSDSSFQDLNATLQTMPASVDRHAVVPDNTWVTVFGFPPSASSFVAMQFSQSGNIIDRKCASKGNWMHLRYQSSVEARKALSNNGKVFAGNIMIGVIPCRDHEVLKESQNKDKVLFYKQERTLDAGRSKDVLASPTMGYQQPTPYSSPTKGYQQNTPYSSPNRFNSSYLARADNARPLVQAYRTAQVEQVSADANVPQRNTSIITKAMEYVFGW